MGSVPRPESETAPGGSASGREHARLVEQLILADLEKRRVALIAPTRSTGDAAARGAAVGALTLQQRATSGHLQLKKDYLASKQHQTRVDLDFAKSLVQSGRDRKPKPLNLTRSMGGEL